MSLRIRSFAILFLMMQGLGGSMWWVMLVGWPESRSPFPAETGPDSTLLAFFVADLLPYVGGAFACAWGSLSRRSWAWLVLCMHTGAAW